jgi:histidinol phosphatase-like PHP family hydrolase
MVCDFHTHSLLSDGALSPLELVRRAITNDYRAIAITDHVGIGYLERLITEIARDCALAQAHWGIIAIPGVELTHIPAAAIAETAKRAKELGARIVVVHGETATEPVEPGTNLAAVKSPHVDILAHPGLLRLEEAKIAAANGVFLEISARRRYISDNKYIAKIAHLAGAKLLLNSDAHDEEDLVTITSARAIAQGADLDEAEIKQVLEINPNALLQRLGLK